MYVDLPRSASPARVVDGQWRPASRTRAHKCSRIRPIVNALKRTSVPSPVCHEVKPHVCLAPPCIASMGITGLRESARVTFAGPPDARGIHSKIDPHNSGQPLPRPPRPPRGMRVRTFEAGVAAPGLAVGSAMTARWRSQPETCLEPPLQCLAKALARTRMYSSRSDRCPSIRSP